MDEANHAIAVTPEQLADEFEKCFRIMAMGLVKCNPMLSPNVAWEAIAAAMGGVLSAATKTPDLAATMALRAQVSDIVAKAIRKKYPPMDMTPANALPANSNGSGVVKFPQ